jgi:membrane-bound ClpP family serine protease
MDNLISRTITGSIMIFVGLILIVVGFFMWPFPVTWIYGLPIFIIGVFIFLNKKEDDIEKININRKRK